MSRRAFVIVMDACGAGALPDAAEYCDEGANTLAHVAEAAGGLDVPVMQRLGLGSALPLRGCPPAEDPVVHGRLHPLGPGKDTITGHWELMGVVTPVALRTYPDGFPPDVLDALRAHTGRPAPLPRRLPARRAGRAPRGPRPRHRLQPPLQRHRRDRRLRPPAHGH